MKHVSFEEYEAAKAEIIGGVHYIEKSTMENDVIHKTYSTEENGTFYEVNDKGRVEFWSDKHSESRIYDENERATETDKKAGPGYGDLLAERIRANADASKLTDFEKFVLVRGYMFATGIIHDKILLVKMFPTKKRRRRLVILNAKEQIPRRMTGTRSIAFIFLP